MKKDLKTSKYQNYQLPTDINIVIMLSFDVNSLTPFSDLAHVIENMQYDNGIPQNSVKV